MPTSPTRKGKWGGELGEPRQESHRALNSKPAALMYLKTLGELHLSGESQNESGARDKGKRQYLGEKKEAISLLRGIDNNLKSANRSIAIDYQSRKLLRPHRRIKTRERSEDKIKRRNVKTPGETPRRKSGWGPRREPLGSNVRFAPHIPRDLQLRVSSGSEKRKEHTPRPPEGKPRKRSDTKLL